MTILIIGGSGKTSKPLAKLLHDANYPLLLTSRSGVVDEPYRGVKFDWHDKTTHENPFNTDQNIDRVYMIGAEAMDMAAFMNPFIDYAVTKGVKRFVFMSATTTPKGSPAMGGVHQYLAECGVDYCVLRPTWFTENFVAPLRLYGIRDESMMATAAGDGRIPFVSVDDIAEVAFRALTDEKSPNTERIIVGPELYNYDEVAAMLTDVLGRKITHQKMTIEEARKFWQQFVSEEVAEALLKMELLAADGEEQAFFDMKDKEVVIGKNHLSEYFRRPEVQKLLTKE